MAKKVVVELVDDLDNSAIEEGEGGVVLKIRGAGLRRRSDLPAKCGHAGVGW